jgi:rubrerythrin
MERKYGQRGYQDNDRDRGDVNAKNRVKSLRVDRAGPKPEKHRANQMPGFQEVLRCALCGTIVPPPVNIKYESQCPKCKADLHSCKNCATLIHLHNSSARSRFVKGYEERFAECM